MGQILECLFWLPHTVHWIHPCWDSLVATRALMRYGSANVKKCHFLAAGATLLKPSVVLEDTCAHTLPPPKVFNLSLQADWNHTANPFLISEGQALMFSASPSSYQKSGCLGDVTVMYSGTVTSEQNTHLSTISIKQGQPVVSRSLYSAGFALHRG